MVVKNNDVRKHWRKSENTVLNALAKIDLVGTGDAADGNDKPSLAGGTYVASVKAPVKPEDKTITVDSSTIAKLGES